MYRIPLYHTARGYEMNKRFIERGAVGGHCKIYVTIDGQKQYVDEYPEFFMDAANALYQLRVKQFEAGGNGGMFRFGYTSKLKRSNLTERTQDVRDGVYDSHLELMDTLAVGASVNANIRDSDTILLRHYEERVLMLDGECFYEAQYPFNSEYGHWPTSTFRVVLSSNSGMHRLMVSERDRFEDFVDNNYEWEGAS